jgi:hypothetical protein
MYYRIPALAVALTLMFAPIIAQAVQFGWQQLPDGGIEYVVQVEPELLDSFRKDGFSSDVPASLQRDLRRIRIVVGNGKLPNEGDVNGPKNMLRESAPTPAAPPDSSATSPGQSVAPRQPTVAAPPLLSAEPAPSTISLPSPPTGTPPPQPSNASTFTDSLPPPPPFDDHPSQPKTESPSAVPPRPLSSLPFFQSGLISKVAAATSPSDAQITTPRLSENEPPPSDYRPFQERAVAAGAAKPAVPDSPFASDKMATSSSVAAKPWLPLMGTLLALFASLGANVYLAWIHQGVRNKYRALVQRITASGVATI